MHADKSRQGYTRKNLSGVSAYESFVPTPLQELGPLKLDDATVRLLTTCARKIGEVEGMARFVPNADMYLTMYVRKEALLSSQIEGTQCTFDDILDPERGEAEEVGEVVRYVAASDRAVELIGSLPLSTRFFREVHRVLLEGVRGQDKSPGEVRTSQNWIGSGASTIAHAPYVPPNPEDMQQSLRDLEEFINGPTEMDPIVRAALVHYQFETIHPFLDGNGRMGRLLITLSLMNDGVLTKPILYPSYQLKLQRADYSIGTSWTCASTGTTRAGCGSSARASRPPQRTPSVP